MVRIWVTIEHNTHSRREIDRTGHSMCRTAEHKAATGSICRVAGHRAAVNDMYRAIGHKVVRYSLCRTAGHRPTGCRILTAGHRVIEPVRCGSNRKSGSSRCNKNGE